MVGEGEDIGAALEAARLEFDSEALVVKAQIHAGGRGKGGGVKVCPDAPTALAAAQEMLGSQLVTRQTGPAGQRVRKLLITEPVAIEREYYLAVTMDRAREQHVVIASGEGGVEIEEVARQTPDKIVKQWADVALGLRSYQCRAIAAGLGFSGETLKEAQGLIAKLYQAYLATDASLAEINPLALTRDGRLLALDAKFSFDDNALFRHPDLAAMRDPDEEDPSEVEASEYNLNYIKLDGNVGCMVNGAGLAMATMDIIKLKGGDPANFLDVGGAASAETVKNGFRIILSDASVKAVLINIFGGIVRCDRIANGVVAAVRELELTAPTVVRLEGTNAAEAREILAASGVEIVAVASLDEAAEKVVALANETPS